MIRSDLALIVVEQLGVKEEEVSGDSSFVDDLGADSLDTVELVMALEEEFNCEIPDEEAEKITTVQQAIAMTARGGTAVLVGVVPMTETVPILAADVTLQEKKITGSYMGSNRFRFDMPKYIDFYLDGRLYLDEMISSRIALEDVNEAFDHMRKGEAARQVIVFD